MTMSEDLIALLRSLVARYGDEALRQRCYDFFRPVYDKLGPNTSTKQMANLLVNYADQQGQLQTLRDWIDEAAREPAPETEGPKPTSRPAEPPTDQQAETISPAESDLPLATDFLQMQLFAEEYPSNERQQAKFERAVAEFLGLSPNHVRVVEKRASGHWVCLALPESEVERLVGRLDRRDRNLLAGLIRLGIEKMELLPVQSPPTGLEATPLRLIRRLYLGAGRVRVERAFEGGYGGAHVLLAQPIDHQDRAMARQILKLSQGRALRDEADKADRLRAYLPVIAARMEGFAEWGGWSGLIYSFMGDGMLGQPQTLEAYYQDDRVSTETLIQTLTTLLAKELGQRWYREGQSHVCGFADEYGRHLPEHLCLAFRPAANDGVWPAAQGPSLIPVYQEVAREDIASVHQELTPGALIQISGLQVSKVSNDHTLELKLPADPEVLVKVTGQRAHTFAPGDPVTVRGAVVYNRQSRLIELATAAFAGSEEVTYEAGQAQLPWGSGGGSYPNPLHLLPTVLNQTLRGRRSRVHGDLHLRNILIDENGGSWLIDFAHVTERHTLFDFIKLETYIRQMVLSRSRYRFTLGDYLQFEAALAATALGQSASPPQQGALQRAYQVIQALREMARPYMSHPADFRAEYFPALFLYSLALLKYRESHGDRAARLAFGTAVVVGRALSGADEAPADEKIPLERALGLFREAVEVQAEGKLQSRALSRITFLEEAVTDEEPDLGGMESTLSWFQRNLPDLAGHVLAVITHPATVQTIQAAGEETMAEFERRFDPS